MRSSAAALLLVLCSACDSQRQGTTVLETREERGRAKIAIADTVFERGVGTGQCSYSERDGVDVLVARGRAARKVRNAQGARGFPDVLFATLPRDLGAAPFEFGPDDTPYGAVASLTGVEVFDTNFDFLQVFGRPLPPYPAEHECRATLRDGRLTVRCNRGTVFPWYARTTERPSGSFEIEMPCSPDDESRPEEPNSSGRSRPDAGPSIDVDAAR